uniref:Uncharacterized protein n=1 Tax=Ascaris lumbricoides TaxID=6252 RepID=A0A0M3IF07_ASCLU
MLSSIVTVYALVGLSSALLEQSVGIRGQLICGNQPSRGDTLKLINHNTIGESIFTQITEPCSREITLGIPDEYVSRADSPNELFDGGVLQLQFKFDGEDHKCILRQITKLDAQLKIYTRCNGGLNPCKREITLGIPKSYVTRNSTPEQLFNGGILQLQFEFKNEGHKCF